MAGDTQKTKWWQRPMIWAAAVITTGISVFVGDDQNVSIPIASEDFPDAWITQEEFTPTGDPRLVIKDPYARPYERYRRESNMLRSSITLEDPLFNAIGEMVLDKTGCTGTIIRSLDYDLTEPGVLVQSAAHCVFDADYNLQTDLRLAFNFINQNGNIEQIVMGNPQIWYDLDYTQAVNANTRPNPHDKALIFFPGVEIPEEIQPINFSVIDDPGHIRYSTVSSGGYAADMWGLSYDDECVIRSIEPNSFLITTCNMSFGTSGGPLLRTSHDGQFESIGTLSGGRHNGIIFIDARFATYTSEDFEQRMPAFFQAPSCVRVTLNLENKALGVFPAPNHDQRHVSLLRFNDVARINPQFEADEWVELRDGGFVSRTHIEPTNCPP